MNFCYYIYTKTLLIILQVLNSYGFLYQCSEGFMHTRMRRRVESLIQVDLKHSFVGSGHSRDLVLPMVVNISASVLVF
jgi:hypothetical protein